MIRKILNVTNIGKLRSLAPQGDVELKRLSLLFAPNGQGKTTLSEILGSYKASDPTILAGRKSLGSNGNPEVLLRLDGGNATFSNGAWSASEPNLLIFGPEFIEENVYSGNAVEHSHKKRLYQVILGQQGVALAQAVDGLDAQIREAIRVQTEKTEAIQRLLPAGLSIDAFLNLAAEEGLEAKVVAAQSEVSALEQAEAISRKEALSELAVPGLPDGFTGTLARTIESLSSDAEARVRAHLEGHTVGADEHWVSQGLEFTKDDECPFCGRGLEGVALISAYRDFLSEAYRQLKRDIAQLRSSITTISDDATVLRYSRVLDRNASSSEFWSQFVACTLPELSESEIRDALTGVTTAALHEVAQKERAPLEARVRSAAFLTSEQDFGRFREVAARYNEAVRAANVLIDAKKAATQAGSLAAARSTLANLKAVELRHKASTATACQLLIDARALKTRLDRQKRTAKQALDQYSAGIMSTWEVEINRLLECFGAGFRLARVSGQYVGGTPSTTYKLVINDVEVDLGASETPKNLPSFKNTLSSGDRATLAFSLFMAQLHHDPALADRIVVFDDPFSSQDRSRRSYTRQCICNVATQAQQVIVLSHDSEFLKLVKDAAGGTEVKTVQLYALAGASRLAEHDLDLEVASAFMKDFRLLQSYVDNGSGDPRAVARAIRPVLEECLRGRFPGAFGENMWLGEMLDAIRGASGATLLATAAAALPELVAINEFSKVYHHDGWESASIDATELHSFAKRTIAVVGGF